jgi:hypothetical protein
MGARSPLLNSYGDDFARSLVHATPDATEATDGLWFEALGQAHPIHRTPPSA